MAVVEVKSSSTFHPDFLRGLKAFAKTCRLPEATKGAVAFNGAAASREVSGVLLANPLDADFADRILGELP